MFSDEEKEILFELIHDDKLDLIMTIMNIKFYSNSINSKDSLTDELNCCVKRIKQLDKILGKLVCDEEV